MARVYRSFFCLLILGLLTGAPLAKAGVSSLDGTMWMYEHESGSRHYVAFYEHYHYLNSSGLGTYNDSLWLRSTFPYFSHAHADGSIT